MPRSGLICRPCRVGSGPETKRSGSPLAAVPSALRSVPTRLASGRTKPLPILKALAGTSRVDGAPNAGQRSQTSTFASFRLSAEDQGPRGRPKVRQVDFTLNVRAIRRAQHVRGYDTHAEFVGCFEPSLDQLLIQCRRHRDYDSCPRTPCRLRVVSSAEASMRMSRFRSGAKFSSWRPAEVEERGGSGRSLAWSGRRLSNVIRPTGTENATWKFRSFIAVG